MRLEIGTSQRLTVHRRQPIVICQRYTVDRRQQIVIVETKRTKTTISCGPWTKFCQRLTDHSQQPIVIVETKRTISANTVDRGLLTTSPLQIVIMETNCSHTTIGSGPLAVDYFCGPLAVDRLTIKKKSPRPSYILIKSVT